MRRSIVLGLVFLLVLPLVQGVYFEWWEFGKEPLHNHVPATCGRPMDGAIHVSGIVGRDSKATIYIPRSYKMGFGNRLYNIEWNNYISPADIESLECNPGELEPTPHIWVQTGSHGKIEATQIVSIASEGEAGRIPGNIFDGKHLHSNTWATPSSFCIREFRAGTIKRGDASDFRESLENCTVNVKDCSSACSDESSSECSSCRDERAQQQAHNEEVQDVENELNEAILEALRDRTPHLNEFPRKGIRGISLDHHPCYVIVEINNFRDKAGSRSDIEQYYEGVSQPEPVEAVGDYTPLSCDPFSDVWSKLEDRWYNQNHWVWMRVEDVCE